MLNLLQLRCAWNSDDREFASWTLDLEICYERENGSAVNNLVEFVCLMLGNYLQLFVLNFAFDLLLF